MKNILFILVSMFFINIASAQIIDLKGMGTVKYQTALTSDDKDKAIENAEMNAIERYFAEQGEAEDQVYDNNEDKIRDNLQKIILDSVVLIEQNSPDVGKYQVTIRAEVNEAKLKNVVKSSSAAASTSDEDKSNIVYFFTARIANSVESYDPRVVRIVHNSDQDDIVASKKDNGSEGERITANQVSTNASQSVSVKSDENAFSKVESGGSVTNKADEVGYKILPMTNYKSATTSIFAQSGFTVIDSDFVLTDDDVNRVYKDYSSGNDISPSTMKRIVKTLKSANDQIKYLVFATLDVGLASMDPSTGMTVVGVSITGRVFNIEGGIPKEIASVPAVQVASVGRNDDEARTAALKKGSEEASREIIAQLNNLSIK